MCESQGTCGLREDSAPLELCVVAFFRENNYKVLKNKGYLSLDLLIDDNPAAFTRDFKCAVVKSLGLIYYHDSSKEISSCKKRLRENLLSVFEGRKKFVMRLTQDHILLLKVFSTLFKYRVKFYSRQGDNIVSQIFGDKEAKQKVRILYDSFLFYIMVNNYKGSPEGENAENYDDSVSTVSNQSLEDSWSSCQSMRLLLEKSTFEEEGKKYSGFGLEAYPQSNSENHHGILDREGCCGQSQPSMLPPHEFESAKPKHSPDSKGTSGDYSDISIILPNTSPSLSVASEFSSLTWSNFLKYLVPFEDGGFRHKQNPHTPNHTDNRPAGVLIGYSASRQCGSILTEQGVEALVSSDELVRAGVPVKLLETSSLRIGTVVRFLLRLLSSEPIPTFEATSLEFSSLRIGQILSSQLI